MTLSAMWTLAIKRLGSLILPAEPEPFDYPFVASDVAMLHRVRSDPQAAAIDDATWNDLLLEQYSARLSAQVSIFGRQVLHQRLRAGLDDAACAQQAERIRALIVDPARLRQLQADCRPLRSASREVVGLLHQETAAPAPWWAGKTWALFPALIAAFAAVIWSPLAYIPAAAILYFLMLTQMRYHDRVGETALSVAALRMLLRVARATGPAHTAAQADQLSRALGRSGAGSVPGAREYADWFMLDNVKHYFKCLRLVHDNRDFLRECFDRVANLEADMALARHLVAMPSVCWAERGPADRIAIKDMVHPLMDAGQPLTLDIDGKGVFISGQNGIGKSTLLRTAGLNLITARAFGFCYAERACVPKLPVYTSMQSEDSLFGGESLYMAELRRAHELLALASGPHAGICIIDEIFRGTNHLESVSAAAAVLDALAAKGLVIVSSHNLVLAPLLAHRLAPLCVKAGAHGQLVLEQGVLAHTNGIALLAQRGFGASIEADAGKVANWLSSHLAHPADCIGVLKASRA